MGRGESGSINMPFKSAEKLNDDATELVKGEKYLFYNSLRPAEVHSVNSHERDAVHLISFHSFI